ncbi:MAG: hypothetical protein ACLR0V_09145 [Roseburia hominis]
MKENSKELSLIYYDDDMLSLIPAFDGKYPEKASEIAVTDAFLPVKISLRKSTP